MNEKEIIKYLQARNPKGIEMLIDNFGKLIYGVLKEIIYEKNTDKEAEDIFYEVIMKIWDSVKLYDEEKGRFRNFIISIAKYTAIDYIRKVSKRKESYFDSTLSNTLEDSTNHYDYLTEKESFEELLMELNEIDKEIFIRRYYLEEEISKIAKDLGKKEEYIYTRLSRGRKRLKEVIGGVTYEQ